jgi:exonuclease III
MVEWVDWSNTKRLLEPIGCVPPREHVLSRARTPGLRGWTQPIESPQKPGAIQVVGDGALKGDSHSHANPALRVVSWNINRRAEAWRCLTRSTADVALLQECVAPPDDVAGKVDVDDQDWHTQGMRRPSRVAVVGLSDRVELRRWPPRQFGEADVGEIVVSRPRTLAVADVAIDATNEVVTLVSMYGIWEEPKSLRRSSWIYADGTVHRLISDLSALIGHEKGHKVIAAGDLNILRGSGENGSPYWRTRYATVFERMEALGLPFVGPQSPNGQQADPWPKELPKDSLNVPTHRPRANQSESAYRQLDFVFASESLTERVRVRALNRAEEWGPSDHCRVQIELSGS